MRVTQSRNIVNSLPKLPDKNLFTTHAPSKVDARKVALEQYLQQVTSLRIKDTRDLCEFLSTNVVERERRREGHDAGWKEGYLTKRGKNFGGWKTRYFVLRGPILEYFDMVRYFIESWEKTLFRIATNFFRCFMSQSSRRMVTTWVRLL